MSKVRNHFGVGIEEYTQMYEEQNCQCAICGITIDTHTADVDHCHIYNLVRGLLCRKCNLALGLFNDDPKCLRRAAEYLEKWQDIHEQEKDI